MQLNGSRMSPIWWYKGYVDSYHFPGSLLSYDDCIPMQIYNVLASSVSAEQQLWKEGDDRSGIATLTANISLTGSASTKNLTPPIDPLEDVITRSDMRPTAQLLAPEQPLNLTMTTGYQYSPGYWHTGYRRDQVNRQYPNGQLPWPNRMVERRVQWTRIRIGKLSRGPWYTKGGYTSNMATEWHQERQSQ